MPVRTPERTARLEGTHSPATFPEPATATPRPSSDADSFAAFTVPQLRERLRAAGLPVSGTRAELVARLEEQA